MRLILLSITAFLAMLPTNGFGDDRLMIGFENNGFILSGAEYWPYHDSTPFAYPEDVLWGFYPERGVIPEGETEPNVDSATAPAVACAELAYRKLQSFFANPHPEFRQVLELGRDHLVSNKFYLWTDDYSRATSPYPPGMRTNRLWYWTRNPQIEGRTPGYWKWESTVLQDGTCLIPEDTQIDSYIRDYLARLGG